MESGQPPHFLWNRGDEEGRHYWRRLGEEKISIRQNAAGEMQASPGHAKHASKLLRAGDDLEKIYSTIAAEDAVMARAIEKFRGMRLTKSGEWETLVSFLCSQNSNMARIRNNVQMLLRDGSVLAPEEILQLPPMQLKKINLGYREQYLLASAAMVAGGEFDLPGLHGLSCEDARAELQRLPGVGPKVADCVLLYGFGRLEAFPNDVWVGRAMQKWYGVATPRQVKEFAERKWGVLAGYAQQYLFMLAREKLR